jgi:hypothetical protein
MHPMSLKETAAKDRVSVRHLVRQIAAGKGPRVIRVGKRLLITAEANDEWLASLEQPPSIKEADAA